MSDCIDKAFGRLVLIRENSYKIPNSCILTLSVDSLIVTNANIL